MTILLTGCASYNANSLTALDPEYVKEYPGLDKLQIGCKAYSVSDCYTYFDRDIIANGYQPIQLTFENKSSDSYVFSEKWVSLPCADPMDVAKKVHTNTAGRVIGYSVGGLFLTPLFIPAVVDGVMSHNANVNLDQDFSSKSIGNLKIAPRSFMKTVIFVPKKDMAPIFNITLRNEDTDMDQEISVSVIR